jgi:hypothetical protein
MLCLQLFLLLRCSLPQFIVNPIENHYVSQFSPFSEMDSFMKKLTNQWKPLTFNESLQYFTSYEACEVFSARRPSWCSERYSKDDKIVDQLGSCAIHETGVSEVNTLCPNLFGTFYHHSSTTSTSSKERTIVDFIITSLLHGYDTLFVIGDSISQQHFHDLICQFRRYAGKTVIIESYHNVYYIKNIDQFLVNNSISLFPHFGVPPSSTIKSTIFTIQRLPLYHAKSFPKEFGRLSNTLTKLGNNSTIVLFNVGPHFNGERIELQEIYRKLFTFSINTLIKEKHQIIMFRETNAQHFPTKSGIYEYEVGSGTPETISGNDDRIKHLYSKKKDISSITNSSTLSKVFFTSCTPILTKIAYDEQNWRNQLLANVSHEIDPSQSLIPIIPFYSITAPRFDLHLGRNFDCTHYCHGNSIILFFVIY